MNPPRTASDRPLMLVSARAGADLRAAVARGERPRPEFLVLEGRHGIELLDWSQLAGEPRRRSVGVTLRHVRAALKRIAGHRPVLSDGEHLGIPLALARRALRAPFRHVVIGHHLTTPSKRAFFRALGAGAGMSAIVLHSSNQVQIVRRDLQLPDPVLHFVPYGIDADFWRPTGAGVQPGLVVAAGREHRDYATLADALAGLGCDVMVAAASLYSPGARSGMPRAWPPNFQVRQLLPHELRSWYAKAALVVVPLLETDFQAGVTVILEAMAMGKAVVVSSTSGQRDIVNDRNTGRLVAPGDSSELRETIRELLGDGEETRRLGSNARQAVLDAYTIERYADRLAALTTAGAASSTPPP